MNFNYPTIRQVIFFFLIFFLVIFLINLIVTHAFAEIPGSAAPAFTLTDVYGKKVSLSDFRGDVVILNFWATSCGPCKAEMPSLNKLFLELKNKGLAVIAISVDLSEKPVISFISEKKLAFHVLMDKNKEVFFDSYAVIGLPATFIIDRKGVIVEKIMGEQAWDSPQMKEKIIDLLTGR